MGDPPLNLELVEQVIGHSPVGIAVIGSDGVYLIVNPAYTALYGYAADQLLGQPFTMLFPPSQRASVQALHAAFLAGQAVMDGEWDVVARDGRAFTVLATSVRVQAASGAARLVSVVDITARKQAERELHATRQFIASVLDGLSAHVCVLDEAGRVLAVNRAWREFAVANGAPASAEMVGSSYVAACEGALQGDPADAGLAMRFLTQLRAVLAGELEAFELEYPCHSPQRQRWFLARVSRIEGSSPLRVVVAHDDVTNLMQAQQAARDREVALRDSEQTYRTLFETVPQGIVYQDLQGRITAANPAAQRILGLSLNQMQGLDSMDPRWKAMQEDGSEFPGEKHPAMVALRTGQPVHDVLMGVQVPERGQAWLLVNAVPLLKQGALDRVYASFEDITQRVLLGREVERQARTDELTGVASRRSILARLNAEFERLHRHPDRRCALLALDLDHFKLVNDRHGQDGSRRRCAGAHGRRRVPHRRARHVPGRGGPPGRTPAPAGGRVARVSWCGLGRGDAEHRRQCHCAGRCVGRDGAGPRRSGAVQREGSGTRSGLRRVARTLSASLLHDGTGHHHAAGDHVRTRGSCLSGLRRIPTATFGLHAFALRTPAAGCPDAA